MSAYVLSVQFDDHQNVQETVWAPAADEAIEFIARLFAHHPSAARIVLSRNGRPMFVAVRPE